MKEKIIRRQTQQQMKRRKLTVGYHYGRLSPLPLNWKSPKMNFVQMIHMWLMGSLADDVAALRYLDSLQVGHFDKEGQKLSRMRRVMRVVQHFACMRGVWKLNNVKEYWNGKTVTTLWNGVWNNQKPHLLTVTSYENSCPDSMHKS
jgi:hypothetical protein